MTGGGAFALDPSRVRDISGEVLDEAGRLRVLLEGGALTYAVRPRKGVRAEYWVHFIPQGSLAEYARKSCSPCKVSLQGLQGNLVPKEEVGELPNTSRSASPQVTTSPGPVDNDDEIDLRVRPGIAALRASIRCGRSGDTPPVPLRRDT